MAFTLLLGVTGTAFAQTPINQSNALAGNVTPVSYTHLTLPTTPYV